MSENLVLLVEDCEPDADLLLHSFKHWGVTNPVCVVTDGQRATDYLTGAGAFVNRDQHPLPIVVLLDLYLPGMAGLLLLEWIRTESELRTLPVVVLSGTKNRADFEKAYALGANACLVKSVDLAELRDLIRDLDYFSLASPTNAAALDFFPEA